MSTANEPTADVIATERLPPYRQPMVTGTGIVRGFAPNVGGAFVRSESGGAKYPDRSGS